VASVVDAEAKAAAKRKKQDAAERKAAAAIEELEAKGRKSNRIKGADSPVPVRCVRAGCSMGASATSRCKRSGRSQAAHDQLRAEPLIATHMFTASFLILQAGPRDWDADLHGRPAEDGTGRRHGRLPVRLRLLLWVRDAGRAAGYCHRSHHHLPQ
jgi:hypothetical protein